ncbi:MAG: hypothetical protein K2X59_04950 [Sphingomonas sp.]|nr:hypothetical protein [Sphingomonas sp.]
MTELISVRSLQKWLGCLYLLVGFVAVLRLENFVVAAVAVAIVIGSYFTARTIPDLQIRQDQILKVCRVGAVVLSIGAIVDLVGGPHALEWAAVVMAYCAGNRLRAAAIGPVG